MYLCYILIRVVVGKVVGLDNMNEEKMSREGEGGKLTSRHRITKAPPLNFSEHHAASCCLLRLQRKQTCNNKST